MPGNGSSLRYEWWTLLAVLFVPLVLISVLSLVVGLPPGPPFALYVAAVVIDVGLIASMIAGWLSLRAVGMATLVLTTALLLLRLALWETGLEPPPDDFGHVVAMLALFSGEFALSFLVLGWRRGVVFSAVVYAVVYGGAVVVASRDGAVAAAGTFEPVAYVAAGQAALIAVLWVFARSAEQLSAVQARAELLALQANRDPLTRLANRRHVDDELVRMVAEAHRYGHELSVVLVDLDFFKSVNDRHGHQAGDRVLVEVAERLRAIMRSADLLARWGGEEFMVLAPHTGHVDACALAERCRRAIADPPLDFGRQTASVGVATLQAGDDARDVWRRADLAMYAAKMEGRDRVVGFRDPTQTSSGRPEVDERLWRARASRRSRRERGTKA